jgi:hypothetical protein
MRQAFIVRDTKKLSTHVTDDFKARNANSTNEDANETNKEQFLQNSKQWSESFSYLTMERQREAYLNSIEYKGAAGLWIQT